MDTREFDRAIDKAAGGLIAREPSRALSHNVMARVRGGEVPTPRGAWLKAACVCAAAIVVAYLTLNRPTPAIPPASTPQVARTEPAPIPDVQIEPPEEPLVESRPESRPREGAVAAPAPTMLATAGVDLATIEPIQAAPITVTPLEVPQLAREATSIENITIEPLTIEPLAASND